MAMTRKDFIILADELKKAKPNPRDVHTEDLLSICMMQWKISVQHVMNACETINPRFDRGVFRKACGYDD